MHNSIEVINLSKKFKTKQVVSNINFKINENASLQNTAYYQFDLSRSSDNRLLYDGDLNIALNERLAFTLTLNYRQDSEPHGDLGKSYIQLKNGIEFIF